MLGSSRVLADMTGAIRASVCKFLCGPAMIFLGSVPGRGSAGSYGNSIFNVLRHYQTVFQSGCSPYQQSVQDHNFSTPLPTLTIVCVVVAIPVGGRWCLIMALICISLVMSNFEHLFMYLVAICVSSLEKYLLMYFACLEIELFVF